MLKQEVACHNGKCVEVKKNKTNQFNVLFEEDNIVNNIERDLMSDSMYGSYK